jgi:flagellar biosynthetic protein FliR
MIGLASPLQPDAMLGAQGTATGRLFGLLAALLVMEGGLHGLPLRALAESYILLPPGAPWPLDSGVSALAQAVAGSLAIGLRLAGPLLLAAVLGNFALGLLSRLAPQVPAFVVAAPGQVLAGLLLLALLLPPLLAAWLATAEDQFRHLPGLP